jgi:Immunity protein 8
MSVNHDLKVRGLDFDTPEFLEWKPEDPLDCDVWAHVEIGDERGGVLFQLHICTAASMKRIENKRHCFVIEQFAGKTDLIARLDSFIAEKTKGCTSDPFFVLAKFWRYEYGKYDKRGHLIG